MAMRGSASGCEKTTLLVGVAVLAGLACRLGRGALYAAPGHSVRIIIILITMIIMIMIIIVVHADA
jgi:hypothetical protein